MGLFDLIVTGAAHPRAEDLSLISTRGWEPIFESWGVIESGTGERVSPTTATALSAYFACIVIVAEDCAKVPLCPFRKLEGGGSDKDTAHATYDLLMLAANPTTTSVNFRQDLVASRMNWGHGYAVIGRENGVTPSELKVLHPPTVRPMTKDGASYYEVRLTDGTTAIVWPEDMLHLRGPLGWSVARQGAQSLGIALAEQSYTGSYLGNASMPAGMLTTTDKLTPEQRKTLGREWMSQQGGKNRGRTAVMDLGTSYKQLSVNPSDAQLLESRQFSVEEVCRWFRVSPHKVMERTRAQGWSTHEITQNEHVSDALLPHMGVFEAELNVKMLTADERERGYYFKHVVQALMRADVKARGLWYGAGLRGGWLNRNEIRAFEDLNPVPGGDVYFISANMVPAELVASGEAFKATNSASESSDKGGPGGAANDDPDAGSREKAAALALGPVFRDVARRLLTKETKALSRLATKHPADSEGGRADFGAEACTFVDRFESDIRHAFVPAAVALCKLTGRAAVNSIMLNLIAHTYTEKAYCAWMKAYDAGTLDAFAEGRVSSMVYRLGNETLALVAASTEFSLDEPEDEKE